MKKIYNKPVLKAVRLLAAESLLSNSTKEVSINDDFKVDGGANGGILSNEEGKYDIWGNEGNGIW